MADHDHSPTFTDDEMATIASNFSERLEMEAKVYEELKRDIAGDQELLDFLAQKIKKTGAITRPMQSYEWNEIPEDERESIGKIEKLYAIVENAAEKEYIPAEIDDRNAIFPTTYYFLQTDDHTFALGHSAHGFMQEFSVDLVDARDTQASVVTPEMIGADKKSERAEVIDVRLQQLSAFVLELVQDGVPEGAISEAIAKQL